MLVIFQIPLLKAMKSIMSLRQLLMHLIIILLMYVSMYDVCCVLGQGTLSALLQSTQL